MAGKKQYDKYHVYWCLGSSILRADFNSRAEIYKATKEFAGQIHKIIGIKDDIHYVLPIYQGKYRWLIG